MKTYSVGRHIFRILVQYPPSPGELCQKKTEKRLKEVEDQLKKSSDSPSSSSPGSTPKRSRQKDVPEEVRVRYSYCLLKNVIWSLQPQASSEVCGQ